MSLRAAQNGHPGAWTSDDVEAAVQEGNCFHRPFGPSGPTPEQLWRLRKPITQIQRDQFTAAVRQAQEQILEARGMAGELISPLSRSIVVRQGIRRHRPGEASREAGALVESGYLLVQRKRISPPFNSPLRDKIT